MHAKNSLLDDEKSHSSVSGGGRFGTFKSVAASDNNQFVDTKEVK